MIDVVEICKYNLASEGFKAKSVKAVISNKHVNVGLIDIR